MNARFARARTMRKRPTDAERRSWRALRYRQIAGQKFRRQRPIGRYIVDFVCLERALIVGVDGSQHAEQSRAYDAKRDTWLRSRGYQVLRFTDVEVLTTLDSVVEAIWQAIAGSTAHTLPDGRQA
jgi:very-short-patch-repair endonuclease